MPNRQFNIERKKYLKEINSNIICDFGTRNKFIRDLKSNIDEYIEDNSITDFSAVREHFGEPCDIAKGFLDTADIKEIKRKMDITKVVAIGIIIALIMWGIGITAGLIDAHKDYTGYERTWISDASIQIIDFTFLGDML